MDNDIKKIDRNMSHAPLEDNITWYDVKENPWMVYGLKYFNEEREYLRLKKVDQKEFESINDNISQLSTNTAGVQARFKTKSKSIYVDVELSYKFSMYNMTPIAQCGFDCYVKSENEDDYLYYGSSYFDINETKYKAQISREMNTINKEIIVNFPLYCGLKNLKIGVDSGSKIEMVTPFNKKPILFYGTSITQGGCVSRPGMVYTNIISRKIDREIYNFGFSGNALGEYKMAEIIRDIDNLGFISLDYEANAGQSGKLEASLKHFIEIIREKHKDVPILVSSRIPFIDDFYKDEFKNQRIRFRNFQRSTVEYFKNQGDENIYFVDGYGLVGSDYNENTIDLIHPTDTGHKEMANSMLKIIKEIIK